MYAWTRQMVPRRQQRELLIPKAKPHEGVWSDYLVERAGKLQRGRRERMS